MHRARSLEVELNLGQYFSLRKLSSSCDCLSTLEYEVALARASAGETNGAKEGNLRQKSAPSDYFYSYILHVITDLSPNLCTSQ